MKDSRVTVWTNTTSHLTGSTTNTGPTIDFMASGVPVGGTYETNPTFGYGVEIIQTNTSGTAQVTTWEWGKSRPMPRPGTTAGTSGRTPEHGFGCLPAQDRAPHHDALRAASRATNTGTGTSTSVAYAADKAGHGSPRRTRTPKPIAG